MRSRVGTGTQALMWDAGASGSLLSATLITHQSLYFWHSFRSFNDNEMDYSVLPHSVRQNLPCVYTLTPTCLVSLPQNIQGLVSWSILLLQGKGCWILDMETQAESVKYLIMHILFSLFFGGFRSARASVSCSIVLTEVQSNSYRKSYNRTLWVRYATRSVWRCSSRG